MLRRVPEGLVAKLIYASGMAWMLFGVLIFLAFARGLLWNGISTPIDTIILPVFGTVCLGTDLVISWIHVMGFLLGSGLSIALGLAIFVYVAPAWQRAHE